MITCYFIDCIITNFIFRGYVYSGSNAVTFLESNTINLGLDLHPLPEYLSDFPGGSVTIHHKLFTDLQVDLLVATVEALCVRPKKSLIEVSHL